MNQGRQLFSNEFQTQSPFLRTGTKKSTLKKLSRAHSLKKKKKKEVEVPIFAFYIITGWLEYLTRK